MPEQSPGPAPRIDVPGGIFRQTRLNRRIRRLRSRLSASASMTDREFGVCSQNGEDGVILELLDALAIDRGFFVEFGVGTGEQGNCVLLADHYSWRGLFMEAAAQLSEQLAAKYRHTARVRTAQAVVTASNVEQLFRTHGVPPDLNILSIDVDGNDYWIWEALRAFRPDIVIAEYNAALGFDRRLVMPRDDGHSWDATDYFGASLPAYRTLGAEHGYDLVHTDRTGVNAFFVRRDRVPAGLSRHEVVTHPANYFGQGIAHSRDPQDRPFLDLDTGQLVSATRAR